MSLFEKTKFLLRKYRIFPKKSFGQHFIADSSILRSMTEYASLSENDVVIDIGAGLGFLTRFLADKCKCVLAVESDAKLVEVLRAELGDLSNAIVIEGDVFKVSLPKFNKVVSIPPYNISSRLLLWLFHQNIECAVLIFQKEFVKRVLASRGDKKYVWLSVISYYYAELELLDDIPKWMFYPQPKVDSAIVRFKPKKPSPFTVKSETLFRQLTQSLFRHRNQKVKNAALAFVKTTYSTNLEAAIKTLGKFSLGEKRVRELAPEDFGVLANVFAN